MSNLIIDMIHSRTIAIRDGKLEYYYWGWLNLRSANLSDADLSYADLRSANLSYADLRSANLSDANLRSANLSDAKEFQSPSKWIFDNLEKADGGIIVYKRFGKTEYMQPSSWVIDSGSVIEANCNPDRGTTCGCGVNVGTRSWCDSHYESADLWKC